VRCWQSQRSNKQSSSAALAAKSIASSSNAWESFRLEQSQAVRAKRCANARSSSGIPSIMVHSRIAHRFKRCVSYGILVTGVLSVAANILLFVASRQHQAHSRNASVGMRQQQLLSRSRDAWDHSGPPLKCTGEATDLCVAKQPGDLRDRQSAIGNIALRKRRTHLPQHIGER
jgi:hypothetical protein